jgi:hypothetical protein
MSWFLAGGFPIVFAVALGLWAVVSALRFAWAPLPGRLPRLVAATAACLFAGAAGTVAGFVAMSVKIPAHSEWQGQLALTVLVGAGEALTPMLLALTVGSGVSILAAAGLARS